VHCDPKVDVIPEWLVDMVLKARPVLSRPSVGVMLSISTARVTTFRYAAFRQKCFG
jgi:hypothetical protein